MFRVHTAIIRSIRCWVAAYGIVHRVLDGWWFWEPLCGSCVRCGWCRTAHTTYSAALKTTTHPKLGAETICYNSTSNSPDDGRMYPKHVELRIHSIKLISCIKLAFHFISRENESRFIHAVALYWQQSYNRSCGFAKPLCVSSRHIIRVGLHADI